MAELGNIVPRAQQVNDALAAWLTAQTAATDAAAEYADTKRQVGSNEAERKALKASTPADHYEIMVSLLPDAENRYKATAAAAERAEKILNVQRELLNHETALLDVKAAEINSATVQTNYAAVKLNAESFATQLAATELLQAYEEARQDAPRRIDVGVSSFEEF